MATTWRPSLWNTTTTTFDLWTSTSTNQIDANDGYYFGGLPPGWTWEGILYVVALLRMRIGLCYIALFCNIVVLLLQIKLQSFRKTQFMFGFVLTISDGIYSVAVLIETHLYYRDVDSISNVYGAVVLASNLLSFFAIIGVGFDRYLALCGIPLKYKLVITTRRYGMIILAMVISSSLYSFVFTRFGTQTGPEVPIRMFIVLTICIATSSLTYVAIGASLLRTFNKTTLGASVKKARIQQTKRLMLAFSLILTTNIICYMPHSLFGLWLSFKPFDQRYGLLENIIIANWLYNIRHLNSSFNPLIYWKQVLTREVSRPSCCKRKSKGPGRGGSSTADRSRDSKSTSLSESVAKKGTTNPSFRGV